MLSAHELNIKGIELFARGDLEGARLHYLASLQVEYDYPAAIANLAELDAQQGNLESSVILNQKLLNIAPSINRWSNLGNLFARLERFEECEAALTEARKFGEDQPAVWHNLALLYIRTHRYNEALEALEQVELLGSGGPQVDNDKAHALFGLGKLKDGLISYEARWNMLVHLTPWDFHIPEWMGEDLNYQNILIHAEQGFGDTIMTIRFVKNLQEKFPKATVSVAVPGCMKTLFTKQNWNLEVLSLEELDFYIMQNFNFHSPLYSMMRWLGIDKNDITSHAYLKSPETLSIDNLDKKIENVGICWTSGKRNNENDWRRRISNLVDWLPLASITRVRLFSLQKNEDEQDIERIGAESFITQINLRDWADTASFISNLDLVISVDTGIVHLSGALGIPTVMLAQYSNCWRWWDIKNGSGKPWYDRFSIFRQPVPGDWKTPINQMIKLVRDSRTIADRLAA